MKLLLALLTVLLPSIATAQNVTSSGTLVPGHTAEWLTTGGIVGDAGGAAGSSKQGSGYLTELGITNTGVPFCINDALINDAGGYHRFCLGANALGGGLISYDALGGAASLPLQVEINGTLYLWPGTGSGNVVGPVSTTIGDVPAWSNTGGSLLSDPGTAFLGAGGLHVAVGTSAVANIAGYALETHLVGADVDTSHSSSAIFARNTWSGSDSNANLSGIYGDIWYLGSAVNQVFAVKGNAYTATDGPILGSFPNQYIAGPNTGTVNYFAGLYGRPAQYLGGTITYATSLLADGLYNIATPAGGAVTNFMNILAVPPYAKATNNYGMYFLDATCSPNCYTATIEMKNDPLILATGTSSAQDIIFRPRNAGAFVRAEAPVVAGSNQTCQAVTQGGASSGGLSSSGTNCALGITSQGTGLVTISENNLPSHAFASVASAVNYVQTSGAISGNAPSLSAQGTDSNIPLLLAPKGGSSVIAGSSTDGTFGVLYAATTASVAGNFVADRIIHITANGVDLYVPAHTATW